ncbi:MAG: AMP-binding protein [Lachnospiraceae bacterium]|nr:AMP-binding protein [Lachnospiraceae bacterium]
MISFRKKEDTRDIFENLYNTDSDSLGSTILNYYDGTICDALFRAADIYPGYTAYEFLGRKVSYRGMRKQVELVAKALKSAGLKPGECVTIALPNCPQALVLFYGVNLAGGVASMIHPLSSEREIEYYLKTSKAVMAVTLDQLFGKFKNILVNTDVRLTIVTGIQDGLVFPKNVAYKMTVGRKTEKVEETEDIIRWSTFLDLGKDYEGPFAESRLPHDAAVILFSGGTTGTTKGVVLTNHNFNSQAIMIKATVPVLTPGDKFIAAMPMFHGFGLGICIHCMLYAGAETILIPRFTAKSYVKLISESKCSYFAGVPTLFEAILRVPKLHGLDFSHLKGIFSGGDSLSADLKDRFDRFLKEHGSTVEVREGYGATETLSACCLSPKEGAKRGSIGIPFADMNFKIVDHETGKVLPVGETGEIIISGPLIMKEYIGNPEETAQTLKEDEDGVKWLYTGDLGMMDEDGFVFFKGRAKRMIIASGYNVYPNQVEAILEEHEKIEKSCVIGVADKYRMEKIKAFIVLKDGFEPNEETRKEIMEYCKNKFAKYAKPNEIEFRASLPQTKIGKTDYRKLEEEEKAQRAARMAV